MKTFIVSILLLLCTQTSFAQSPFTADDFINSKKGQEFDEFMKSFDLEDTKYLIELKTSSTSVGLKVAIETLDDEGKKKTKKLGTWLPENTAAVPEAQVVAYYLSQFLHMSDYVVPTQYYVLGPKMTETFKSLLDCTLGAELWQFNCNTIKTQYVTMTEGIDGAMRDHVKDEVEVPGMIAPADPDGTLNTEHIIAQFISAEGPMPSAEKELDLGVDFEDPNDKEKTIRPTDTELNLARQFSQIMVLDILIGQWDRFSGANIEAIYNKKKNVVQFIARDNGGGSMWVPGMNYFSFLSRFDASQIERVKRLLNLIESNPDELHAALHMRAPLDQLKLRCEALLAHVKSVELKYGVDKTYFTAP